MCIIALSWYILTLGLFIQEYDILPSTALNFLDNYLIICFWVFSLHLYIICAGHMYVGTHMLWHNWVFYYWKMCTVHMWQSEDTFQELVLSFSMATRDQMRVWGLCLKCSHPLSPLTSPVSLFLMVLNQPAPLKPCWQCSSRYPL